jgi:ketosteroid isomerase-like protein
MDDEGVMSTLAASTGAGASATSPSAHGSPSLHGASSASSEPAPTAPPLSKGDTVAHLFEAFSRRDVSETLAFLHPEVVFQPMTAEVTQAGEPYCSHEGILRYAADVEAQWDELTVHPTQIRAAGKAVVALGLVSGSGRAGSFENAPTTWVFKFKDNLIVHAQIFSEARYVFEALGDEDS